MKKYKVGIYTPNKIFMIKGRVVRSPFEVEVLQRDLQAIKMKIKTDGIDKFSIEELFLPLTNTISMEPKKEVTKTKEQNIDIKSKKQTEIKIEELEKASKSLLEKFINS
jgi:hypothetical protein